MYEGGSPVNHSQRWLVSSASAALQPLIKHASRRRASRYHPDEGFTASYFAISFVGILLLPDAISTATSINSQSSQ
eukprot:m.293626 g.293626  ORF g.293626 m.293626 type:complete len:76 (-) comp27500_c0_seq1:90-317(-)